jgi:PAS domain S-box-containing protein
MAIMETGWDLPGEVEALIDPVVLAGAVFPLLYFLLFRPMVRHMEERRQVEEALRYSEEKYSMLVESSLAGIFIYRDGKFAFANQQFAEMLGYSRDELHQVDPQRLIHPDDWPRVAAIDEERMAGGEPPAEYEGRAVKKSGETLWLNLRSALIQYRGGPSILGNVLDITRRKQIETALADSESELRRLSSQLLAAQEEERGRVAREIHDSVGQAVSTVKFAVERVLAETQATDCGEATLQLQSVLPMIERVVEEVRRISMGLRPSTLDDLGLVATISWHCREFQVPYPDIRVETRIEVTEEEIPAPLKIVAYRILQEALNNVAKHSGADRAVVLLCCNAGGLELTVEDDGQGFEVETAFHAGGPARGYGLVSMRERAEFSSGALSVETIKVVVVGHRFLRPRFRHSLGPGRRGKLPRAHASCDLRFDPGDLLLVRETAVPSGASGAGWSRAIRCGGEGGTGMKGAGRGSEAAPRSMGHAACGPLEETKTGSVGIHRKSSRLRCSETLKNSLFIRDQNGGRLTLFGLPGGGTTWDPHTL